MVEILEATMIILFGLSWPINIIKSVKVKTAKGKSLVFLLLIDIGYLSGILSKVLSKNITWVIIFYIINFLLVFADIVMYFINTKRDQNLANT